MKLDSEEQRQELLGLLGSINIQVPIGEVQTIEAKVNAILDPIRNAEIEVVKGSKNGRSK